MNLKQIMFNTNTKQNKMAKDLNLNTTTLNNYINEKTQPDIETLIKLANYFDVSLDYMCGRQYNNQVGYIPDDKKEVVRIILQLNEINTIKLFGYASGLLAGQN